MRGKEIRMERIIDRNTRKTIIVPMDHGVTNGPMAGLIDLIQKGRFTSKDTVVFVHTGGIPDLFLYGEELSKKIGGDIH